MQYILFHKKIRNDEHCPVCRRMYITSCKTLDDAMSIGFALDGLDSTDIYRLKIGSTVWVDEWERRRNGDQYQILQPETNHWYSLQKYDITDGKNEEFSNGNKTFQYMSLHIRVRPSEWCPDNILYYAAFHETLDEAVMFVEKRIEETEERRRLELNNDTDEKKDLDFKTFQRELRLLKGVW